MDEPRLFLLDAYALIFRAYYALIRVPRVTSEGINTSAIFGFVNTLEELLRKENPSHIAVCFDPSGPTFRHEAYKEYKGERDATPEDIRIAIPYIKRIIEAYGIPVMEVAGFEADDVIGTLATEAEKRGFLTYMMTPDKDFGQLVTDRILQYKPAYRGDDAEIRGPKEVCERYGIQSPSQVIDLLALMGDKVDNIPGCPGVGEKTASRLIGEFGSVEELIERADTLKGALRKRVEENAEQIVFSKFLATIRTDVPVEFDPEKLRREGEDTQRLFAVFNELEFKNLQDRVSKRIAAQRGETSDAQIVEVSSVPKGPVQGSLFDDDGEAAQPLPAAPRRSMDQEKTDYSVVTTLPQADELLASIPSGACVGFYAVAPDESDFNARVLGLAVAVGPRKAVYIPASAPEACTLVASTLLGRGDITLVSPDMKHDQIALRNFAVGRGEEAPAFPERFFDTSIAHYLLQPDLRHDLPTLAGSYLNITVESLEELAGGKTNLTARVAALPEERLRDHACRFADLALRLREPLRRELEAEGLSKLYTDMELPLVPILASMEVEGVRVDITALAEIRRQLEGMMADAERHCWELAGEEFNVGSPARVGEILFDKLKLDPKAKKTKTGKYSTSEEVLDKLSGENPIIDEILRYRQLKKLINTYLVALPEAVNPATGKIHTTYNQTVTATGRISSSNPNMQNIPVRQGLGREIRRAFIPDPGHLFLSADYSQIELRLVADFAKDPVMVKAFNDGTDIHAATAAKIYHRELGDVTPDERRKAKTANFGILYGISAFGLANRLHIPRAEAKELIDNYFNTFPTIRQYMADSISNAQEQGFVTTIHGRRRLLPDIKSRNPVVRGYAERNAINAPIQGSAADIIKIAMIRIFAEMRERGLRSKMIMQVHDELNFDVVPEEAAELRELVTRCMQESYRGGITLTAGSGIASNWLEAH